MLFGFNQEGKSSHSQSHSFPFPELSAQLKASASSVPFPQTWKHKMNI